MSTPAPKKVRTLTAAQLGLPTGENSIDNKPDGIAASTAAIGARNIIFFGPPGVGKSFAVKQETSSFNSIRTVFHPEYSYGDFIGTYRPVVGTDPNADKITAPLGDEIDRPVNYFEFVPGPMTYAILKAHNYPSQHICLIIEEINRGDCAAIFGDFFQLLDRDSIGQSEYELKVSTTLQAFLEQCGVLGSRQDLRLPQNLSIYATMNTSDQALFPMDSAFKRRWEWKSVRLMAGEKQINKVTFPFSSGHRIGWIAFLKEMNNAIVSTTNNEDKQVGPWYVKFNDPSPTEATDIKEGDIRNKLLYYLWHDVFRNDRRQFFKDGITTFDSLQQGFDDGGGIGSVIKDSVKKGLEKFVQKVEASLAAAEEVSEPAQAYEAQSVVESSEGPVADSGNEPSLFEKDQ